MLARELRRLNRLRTPKNVGIANKDVAFAAGKFDFRHGVIIPRPIGALNAIATTLQ
jgi:hypothetical protein